MATLVAEKTDKLTFGQRLKAAVLGDSGKPDKKVAAAVDDPAKASKTTLAAMEPAMPEEDDEEGEGAKKAESDGAENAAAGDDAGQGDEKASAAKSAAAAADDASDPFDRDALVAICGDDDAFLARAVREGMGAVKATTAYIAHLQEKNLKLTTELDAARNGGAGGASKADKTADAAKDDVTTKPVGLSLFKGRKEQARATANGTAGPTGPVTDEQAAAVSRRAEEIERDTPGMTRQNAMKTARKELGI